MVLRLKQNHDAFRHLGYSYLSSDMPDVNNLVKVILCLEEFLVIFIIIHVVLLFSVSH